MRDFKEMIRQLRMGGAIDPLQMDAACALTAMRYALASIADQKLTSEMAENDLDDFEGAYDIMIGIARKALGLSRRTRDPDRGTT